MKHLFGIACLIVSTAVAGCAGFQPLHGTTAAQAAFSDMAVTVNDGQDEADRVAGFLIQQRLADRMGITEEPTYQLTIDPSSQRIGLGLTAQDFATRFDGVVTARWKLTKRDDGSVLASGTSRSTATYSTDRDPYRLQSTSDEATKRASRDVADRVLADVALEIADLPAAP